MGSISEGLLAAFEASKLTYDELAKRTMLPKSALYRYLNGDTEKIPIDRFQTICAELHIDAADLLGWRAEPLAKQESYIVDIFRSLPDEGKQYLFQQAQIAKITFGEKSVAVPGSHAI